MIAIYKLMEGIIIKEEIHYLRLYKGREWHQEMNTRNGIFLIIRIFCFNLKDTKTLYKSIS